MPRELITIQVGQCGNQIGCRFWDLARQEHRNYNKNNIYDEPISAFFRNVDQNMNDIHVGDGSGKIQQLKARAVLIDTEQGVVNEILRDRKIASLFEAEQIFAEISGAGNNWANGYVEYGSKYEDVIVEAIRRAVSYCDSLQSFLMIHSLGGGTGSGLGSFVLELLEDHFPEAYRFTTSIFPSEDDDVITSPYNSILSLSKLIEHADCVLPVDNQSLIDISNKMIVNTKDNNKEPMKSKPFDMMNNIAAHLLLNLTSSMRFGGSLNVDLNEITMNLVPYPRMHFLLSSLTPLYSLGNSNVPPRSIDQMFTDAFSPEFQLIRTDPKRNVYPSTHMISMYNSFGYLACALMVRGVDVEMSVIRRNIERMKPTLQFAYWNQEGWKVGHCVSPSLGQKNSLLCLSNNCCIKEVFKSMQTRFNKLYTRKAHLHHYTDLIPQELFEQSTNHIKSLIEEYSVLEKNQPFEAQRRFTPI